MAAEGAGGSREMNPTIKFSGYINGSQVQGLLIALKTTTGRQYGYMPQDMLDTQFCSIVLNLCGTKWTKKLRPLVHATITGWAIGYGLGIPSISFPPDES